ncbi:MAG: CPBP family intramembrane glutamic endopeptidase [Thermoguttaceae bacterium]
MKRLAIVAAAFEGSLALLAVGLGWLLERPAFESLHLDGRGSLLGLLATAPPLAMCWICLTWRIRPLQEVIRVIDEVLAPMFRGCGLLGLALVAALAGLGEESLFRGVVQSAVASSLGGAHGPWIGLLVAAVLFGLLHLATPTYGVLATLMGGYFGWIWLATGNLLVPIAAHAVYDFLVLLYFVKRRQPPVVAER